jgi:hypothetical protein
MHERPITIACFACIFLHTAHRAMTELDIALCMLLLIAAAFMDAVTA